MKKQHRLRQKLDSLNTQWDALHGKLSKLEQARIVETDVAQQIKLDSQITETRNECERLEKQTERLEEELSQSPNSLYKLVFINADRHDFQLCEKICGLLETEETVEFVKPKTEHLTPPEIRKAFEAWVLDCDALVVIYGNSDFGWLNQIFKNIRKVVWRRAQSPLPAYVLCEPSPKEKQLIEFSFRGISELQYASLSDELQFRDFINSL